MEASERQTDDRLPVDPYPKGLVARLLGSDWVETEPGIYEQRPPARN